VPRGPRARPRCSADDPRDRKPERVAHACTTAWFAAHVVGLSTNLRRAIRSGGRSLSTRQGRLRERGNSGARARRP
jgi:hypothetical protein